MNVLDEFKNYKRKFIQISHRTAILMHIFEKSDDDFEDIILSDHEEYYKQNHNINIYKEAADQFFKQFEGEETEWTNVRVANVSILDESYSIYFKPTTFEL